MGYNVLVTRRIPQAGLDILEQHCDTIDVNPHDRPMTHEELETAVKGRDGVLCLLNDTVDEAILKAADQAKIFANYAVGYNNIDVKTATDLNIMVTNTPGVLTDATADLAWALLFSAARKIVESDKYMRAGKFIGWAPMLMLGADIAGKTLGVVGAGRIGEAVAMRSAGFRMNVLYTDVNPNAEMEQKLGAKKVSLDELLEQSDFISLHVPLLPETRHLIGPAEFAKMKETAILINTSRGPVVDEAALAEALETGAIQAAGLDVFEEEPSIHPGLMKLDNAVILPHIGSATVATRTKMATMAAENLVAGLKGEKPENWVNVW